MKAETGTFCTIFPGYRDFHFYKDPGQLPYRVSKLGFRSYIVCYGDQGDYPETEKYLKVRALGKRRFSRKFNAPILRFLLLNACSIDILNVFHMSWSSLLFAGVYKLLNKRGFAYLKLDNCIYSGTYPWEEDFSERRGRRVRKGLKQQIRNLIARKLFIGRIDLWSVEDEYSRREYESRHPFFRGRIITITNGHTSDLPGSLPPCGFEMKDEIILSAGRLGTYQKATEVLLEAFRLAAPGNNYALHFAGTVEPAFSQSIEIFMNANPDLRGRIVFHGPLGRDELYRLYCRSRIFCMSSRYEGMAIVFPEAMYYRNAIVTTWPVSLKYFIDMHDAGIAVEKDDPEALADSLKTLIADNERREKLAEAAYETAVRLMNWDVIAGDLITEIRKRSNIEERQS